MEDKVKELRDRFEKDNKEKEKHNYKMYVHGVELTFYNEFYTEWLEERLIDIEDSLNHLHDNFKILP